MKKDTLILIAAICLAGASVLRSQDDAVIKNPDAIAKNPAQMLKALKASNADLIEKQKKTLDSLDEMQKTADQIRILAKRT